MQKDFEEVLTPHNIIAACEQGYRGVYGEMSTLIASWAVERLGTPFLKDILKNISNLSKFIP